MMVAPPPPPLPPPPPCDQGELQPIPHSLEAARYYPLFMLTAESHSDDVILRLTHQRTSPVVLAAEQGDEAVVKVLLEYGANPNKGRTDCNSAALEGAAVKGHLGIMQLLLHYKAKVRTSFFSFFLSFFSFSFFPSFFLGGSRGHWYGEGDSPISNLINVLSQVSSTRPLY